MSFRRDMLRDVFKVAQDIASRNPQRPHAARAQPSVAYFVVVESEIVRLTINFNAKLGGLAVEIENEVAGGMLLSEMMTCLAPAESAPQ